MAGEIVLLVRLGGDAYAIPITCIAEVLPALPIEAVPQCPPFVRGVIFVRGHLIPVLDAAERLGLNQHEPAGETHIVCMWLGNRLVGVEFDEALDLLDLTGSTILPAADLGARSGFFTGVVEHDGRLIRLLDPQRLIAPEEADVHMSLIGSAALPREP